MVPGSIESRAPREPDIRCVIAASGPHCFELVEVIDSESREGGWHPIQVSESS